MPVQVPYLWCNIQGSRVHTCPFFFMHGGCGPIKLQSFQGPGAGHNKNMSSGGWCPGPDDGSHAETCESVYIRCPTAVYAWAHVFRRSPDLNPIEKYWAWLRKDLRRRDLADLVLKRPVLNKASYTKRVQAVLRSRASQLVAKRCALGLRAVCKEVILKKGAATKG